MDIGTAQSDVLPGKIQIHLTRIIRPDESFSAALFAQRAKIVISEILNRNRIPVLSGGTGFYFRALRTGLFEAPPNEEIRKQLQSISDDNKLEMLRKMDPRSILLEGHPAAGKIHPNDKYRVDRALEITMSTGMPWSEHWKRAQAPGSQNSDIQYTGWFLSIQKDTYSLRLEKRARRMIESGFIREALTLRDNYGDCPGLRTLGYSLALDAGDGKITKEELISQLAHLHRKYGKRQLTWFHRESVLSEIAQDQFPEALAEAVKTDSG